MICRFASSVTDSFGAVIARRLSAVACVSA
jgi:hypothetical protein